MEVKLRVVGGKNEGQELPVPGPKFFIGRAEDCHLRPQSDQVSRHHAVILVEEGFVAIRDFGSRNGTYVNGERVKTEQELRNGDKLKLGPLEFEVQLAVAVGGKKKPKVKSVSEAAARTVASGADGELDIFGLLGEEETPAVAAADTQTLPAEAKETVAVPAAGPEEKPPGKPKEEKKKKKKKGGILGGSADPAQPTTESSRSAAEDMLRQFMNRKS